MAFEDFDILPNEMIEYICSKASLKTLLNLSETSWKVNQVCSKIIKRRKAEYLEEKRIQGLIDDYFGRYKEEEGHFVIPLGPYEPDVRHDIDLDNGFFSNGITEQFIEGEHPILPDLFPGRISRYKSNVQYEIEGPIFDFIYLNNSTDEDRRKVLRKLAKMNIL